MKRPLFPSLPLITFGALTLTATLAWAEGEPCDSDAECGEGEACEVVPVACPAIAVMCADDAVPIDADGDGCALECPDEAGTDAGVPEAPPAGICVTLPVSCTTDADCDAGEVCHTYAHELCSGQVEPACPPGEDCPEPPPPPPTECEVVEESLCVPRYFLGCAEDADCGAGFTCEPMESCACSGSAGSPGGGAPPEPTEPECVCEPTGEGYCALVPVDCETDANCPEGWSCEELTAPTQDCAVDSDGNVDCGTPVASTPQCVPPGYLDAPAAPGSTTVGGEAGGGAAEPAIGPEDDANTVGDAIDDSDAEPNPPAPADDESKPFSCAASGARPVVLWGILLGLLALRRRR